MQFTGIITRIVPPVKVNTKKGENWTQTFELTYEQGQYPRKIAFEVFGTDKLNEFRISLNEQVMCYIDFDVAEVNGRLFNRVRCWKVERMVQQQAFPQPYIQQAPIQNPYQSQASPVQQPYQGVQQPPQANVQQMPPQQAEEKLPF